MVMYWTENLSVGNETLDRQHRELIESFRSLLHACREGLGKEKVEEIFSFLDTYVVTHFRAEEKLMAEHGYPGLVEHRSQHAWLIARLTDLKRNLQEDGPSFPLVIETTQTLMDWIGDHIRKTDVHFGQYLKNQT